MRPGIVWGLVLLGLGVTMIVTSENHNVGYITSVLGIMRVMRSMA